MLDQIKNKLKYIVSGDPTKVKINPIISAQSGQMTGSEIVNNNPSFLSRIGDVLGGKQINTAYNQPANPGQSLSAISNSLPAQQPSPSGSKFIITPTPVPQNPVDKILSQYQIPPSVFYGMRDAEGGKIGANNPMNIGAFDSNPQNAANYNSPEAGIEAFAKLIAQNPRYAEAYAQRNNPDVMLQAIMDAGYAGDPSTWKQRSASTGGAGKTYDTYAEFVKNTPGWRKNYKK
jgi:hypothetical protein